MENKIINGDAFVVMDELKVKKYKFDAIITDPPYNISKKNNFSTLKTAKRKGINFGEWDYNFDQFSWIEKIKPLLKVGGAIIIFNTWLNISFIAKKLELEGFIIKDLIRWIKTNPMPRNMNRRYLSDYEFAIWAIKPGKKWVVNTPKGKKYLIPEIKTAVVNGNERTEHPTQKSIYLMKKIIETHTNKGDYIFDPFAGSGTTHDAAVSLGRKCFSIEKNKKYYNIIVSRINKLYK